MKSLTAHWLNSLTAIFLVGLLFCGSLPAQAQRASIISMMPPKSISSSGQFFIYSANPILRMDVANMAENTKSKVLAVFGKTGGGWKYPIVISVTPASSAMPNLLPVTTRLYQINGAGFKVEIDARVGDDPSQIDLQKQVVQAVLLEFMFRRQTQLVRANHAYAKPPEWLSTAILQSIRSQKTGSIDHDIYKTIVVSNYVPALQDFLTENTTWMDSISKALYKAYAFGLLQALTDLPNGRAHLAQYLRDTPKTNGDPVHVLTARFPKMKTSPHRLAKWWTLSIAKLSATIGFQTYSVSETEKRLAPLLKNITVETDKKGHKKTFAISEFTKFEKLKDAKSALGELNNRLNILTAQANPLYRPILAEYRKIIIEISRRKTRKTASELATVSNYRKQLQQRVSKISDYLNWYEATQMHTVSGAFDDYIKMANAASKQADESPDTPISRYLDKVQSALQ